jgi:hypothetical protein
MEHNHFMMLGEITKVSHKYNCDVANQVHDRNAAAIKTLTTLISVERDPHKRKYLEMCLQRERARLQPDPRFALDKWSGSAVPMILSHDYRMGLAAKAYGLDFGPTIRPDIRIEDRIIRSAM